MKEKQNVMGAEKDKKEKNIFEPEDDQKSEQNNVLSTLIKDYLDKKGNQNDDNTWEHEQKRERKVKKINKFPHSPPTETSGQLKKIEKKRAWSALLKY